MLGRFISLLYICIQKNEMYLIKEYFDKKADKNKCFYHERVVPFIFVALWIAGLTFSIINPPLPLLGESICTSLLSSLVYIYFVFIIEVFVTFTDIHNVYRLYNAKKLLWEIFYKRILPSILLTIGAFIWYYYHQRTIWLMPFVFFSAYVKFEEVWLANNGDTVFTNQQQKMDKDKIFRPQKLS